MPTGTVLFPAPQARNVVDDVVAQARRAHDLGVRQVWLAQQFDHDAIALAALVGAAVPGLGVGTSVVPINPRHPLIVASLAQTAQAAAHGNFSLGLGLGAHQPERLAFGTSWPNTIQRLREHLTILRSIFDAGSVDFHGDELSASPAWPVTVAGGTPVPVYVAAMGPKALQVTGELADGTLPYLAGPRTIAEFIEPTIAKAAADAGRPKPRIIAAVPALVSDDVDAARGVAAEQLSFYETIPSYQKVIAREGVESVADLAAVGSAESVTRQLRSYLDAGATDVVLSPLDRSGSADHEALWAVAATLQRCNTSETWRAYRFGMPSRRRSALVDRLVVDQPGRPQQEILDELRRVILDGAVPPGTPIPLAEVANLFGVSQIPVRESLKTLIGEGLVTHRSNSGYTVAQLTVQELREMYIVRETLESASLAAALANATDADRAAIVAVNEVLQQAVRDDDPLTYQRQSRQFHIALTRPSRMYRLLHMLEAAWNVTEPVQSMVHVAPSDRAHLHTDHCQMVDAFLAGDVEQLLAVSELHAQRLNSVIATLPTDTGLLAPPDISFTQ